jgi:hypothetical protein
VRLALALSIAISLPVLAAAPKARPVKPAVAAPTPDPAPAATPPPAPVKVNTNEPTATLLERASGFYQGLEYDRVIPLAEAVIAREDVTLEQKLEGYRLLASARAIVEDPIVAEQPFRMLLRARPDYELPKDTSPRILDVFKKVQTEEKNFAAQLRELERGKVISGLKLLGEGPTESKGGKPLRFSFRLKDPTGAVDAMRLPYRRAGQPAYSSLALNRGDEGDWNGTIPGEFTSDEKGFTLEYFVETLDAKGPLLSVGTEKQPKAVAVSAGVFSTAKPPPLHKGVWFAGLALSAAVGAAAGGVGIAFNDTQTQYKTLAGSPDEVDGARLQALRVRGESLGDATTGLLISTGVAVLATAVMTPFVNWAGQ